MSHREVVTSACCAGPSLIGAILPEPVTWAETFDDPPEATLFPQEDALLARAVDKRRKEFTTGRFCARRALARMGRPAAPILRGARGEPLWPPGVAGSITHCDGYRAAATAAATSVASIGIDAEPREPLPEGLVDRIAQPAERARLDRLNEIDGYPCWDRLLFCAKEAVYKAWFPLARTWLGFDDVDITIDRVEGTFSASLLVTGPRTGGRLVTGFDGKWLVTDALLLATVTVTL